MYTYLSRFLHHTPPHSDLIGVSRSNKFAALFNLKYHRLTPAGIRQVQKSSSACAQSSFLWCSIYFWIIFVFTPVVLTKYPSDQIPLSTWYIFCKKTKYFINARLVLLFNSLTASPTAIFGGMDTSKWTWSLSWFSSFISICGWCFVTSLNFFSQ